MPRRPGTTSPLAPLVLPTVHLARDHTPSDVRARVRHGEWNRVRSGAYVAGPAPADPYEARDRIALARLAALSRQLTTPFVFSHLSAALLWRLPTTPAADRAHITQTVETRGPDRDLVRHLHHLRPEESTTVAGLPVTTLGRTVVDCATSLPPRWGLVLADAALRAGADRAELLEICGRMAGRRGVVAARAVLDLADDGAESPGESATRLVVLRAGFPVPQTQIAVATRLGTFWADLGWPEWRVLIEYDGRVKYAATDALVAEKHRQDAIEEAGWRVLRVMAQDLSDDAELTRRVLRVAPPGTAGLLRPRPALRARAGAAWASAAPSGGCIRA